MRKIILKVEVIIDDETIVRKYPNFVFNYTLKRDRTPTQAALLSFARKQVMTENSLRSFGFSAKIVSAKFADAVCKSN